MLCMPSVRAHNGESEGLGLVNLEAQATALPVVATRHGGIPEAVEHGVTGLLCAERDPNALAENMLYLLSDGDLRTKMGIAGRARVIKKFNLKNQSELLEQYYLEFL
jgi:glycosyltransferase involved in cell wall biosynthesis